ncbi:hypothetical protein ILYODFUR_018550 [Ilyodon furcidens]|uniref:Uncharacterized protein n=1 Tax=Ilyodon furcidens TaxID=33524 RepID=A0ABV0TD05_9TELE
MAFQSMLVQDFIQYLHELFSCCSGADSHISHQNPSVTHLIRTMNPAAYTLFEQLNVKPSDVWKRWTGLVEVHFSLLHILAHFFRFCYDVTQGSTFSEVLLQSPSTCAAF